MTEYQDYTVQMAEELYTCLEDPIYFINNYVQVRGQMLTLNSNQIEWANDLVAGKVVRLGRHRAQGRTTIGLAFLLWKIVFNPDKTCLAVTHCVMALNDMREMLNDMIASLPSWMRPQVVTNNKNCIQLANGSKVIYDVADGNTGRGLTVDTAFLDNVLLYGLETRRDIRMLISVMQLSCKTQFIIGS